MQAPYASGEIMTVFRVVILLIIVGVALGAWSCWQHNAADRDFERLLTGAPSVAIVRFECEGQGRRIILTDSASLTYLSERFRSARKVRGNGDLSELPDHGTGYNLSVRLSTGASIRCGLEVLERKDRLTVSFPLDTVSDPWYYSLSLPEPIPERLFAALAQMRSP
jgi:hypothetical protein